MTHGSPDLGYYALAVTTYAPDAPRGQEARQRARSLLQSQGMEYRTTPRNSARSARPSLRNLEKSFTELRALAAGVANSLYAETETTNATEVKNGLNETLPVVAERVAQLQSSAFEGKMATAMAAVNAAGKVR